MLISTIARKEAIELSRSGYFRWGACIVFLLLLLALLAGIKNYRDISHQHAEAQAETRRQWISQGARNPHSAAHYGIYAFKPRLPVSLFDRGVEDYTGISVWLEAHKQNDLRFRPAQDLNGYGRFGELTAATVLQLFLPLLIVVVTFPQFAGERETGTLRQLLSVGVTAWQLALGKVAGVGAVFGLFLLPVCVMGSAALMLSSGTLAGAMQTLSRFAILIVSYLAYEVVFLALSLAISGRARSSQAALSILLGFWIASCLLIPRVATDWARKRHHAPSIVDFNAAIDRDMKQGIDGHDPANQRAEKFVAEVLRQYRVERPELLPVNIAGLLLDQSERYGNQVFDRHFGRLWNTFKLQDEDHQLFGFLSPTLATRTISMAAAGTDLAHHQRFAQTAESYRRLLMAMMNNDIAKQSRAGDVYVRSNDFWKSVPPFEYKAPDCRWALGNHLPSILALLFWAVVSMGAAVLSVASIRPL